MAFLVLQQILEKLHGDVVARIVADLARFRIAGARVIFAGEIALQHLADILADPERRDGLQVRMAFEEDDAMNELVGVMHLLDRFRPLLLGEFREAPILGEPVMHPVLVDGPKLQFQRLVQAVDYPFVAFHDFLARLLAEPFLGQFRPARKLFRMIPD